MTAATSPLSHMTAPRTAALVVTLVAAATIGTALFFQYGLGYVPCALCFLQRWPYYVALPLGLVAIAFAGRPVAGRGLLALLGIVFVVSTGLGAYHAGVEWGVFAGPADCGGATDFGGGESLDDFLGALEDTRIVSCTEAAFRVLGLSMAGWNAVISLGLAGLAFVAAGRRPRR